MTRNKVGYAIQYHADQDLDALRAYWSAELAIPSEAIRLQRKSNSSGLAARSWRSRYGVLTISVGDTQLRCRLQGWIDAIEQLWLDSIDFGGSEAWLSRGFWGAETPGSNPGAPI